MAMTVNDKALAALADHYRTLRVPVNEVDRADAVLRDWLEALGIPEDDQPAFMRGLITGLASTKDRHQRGMTMIAALSRLGLLAEPEGEAP